MVDTDPPTELEAPQRTAAASRRTASMNRGDMAVLALVVAFYLATRLIALTDYPAYFFCDEAIHGTLARDLVDNGLHGDDGSFLPAYFRNVEKYNLGLSVWLHALPVHLLGATPMVIRATSVAVGSLAVVAVCLLLRLGPWPRYWWSGGLALAAFPAWFLHSRTAFETVMMVAFYACFLLAYLLYRTHSPRWGLLAIACGAATFSSYSNGQGVIFVSAILLLLIDRSYHLEVIRQRPQLVVAMLALTAVVVAPYLRFRFVDHPQMVEEHLRNLRSYWMMDLSLGAKLHRFLAHYLLAFDPATWFTEQTSELTRHRMLGRGHLPWWAAPPLAAGLGACLWKLRQPACQLMVVAVLAAPFSAALVGFRITRCLAMVVPVAILVGMGFGLLHHWLGSRRQLERALSILIALGLVTASGLLTRDAIANGPRWYSNYGLDGLQWGAQKVFAVVDALLETHPDATVAVSHAWTNNPQAFVDLFLDPGKRRRVTLLSVGDILRERRPLPASGLFVISSDELVAARADGKLALGPVLESIPYPDGTTGFVAVRITYSEAATALFAADAEAMKIPIESTARVDGRPVAVVHSPFDLGTVDFLFDRDPNTLARTGHGDPAVVEIALDPPRRVEGLALILEGGSYHVRIELASSGNDQALIAEQDFRRLTGPAPEVAVRLATPAPDVRRARVEISKRNDVHIQIRELRLLPDAR